MSQAPVEPRVGDRGRHAADELLRAARTRSEVDVLLADLPGAAPVPPVEVVVPDGAQVDTGGLVVFGSVDGETACSTSNTGPRISVRPVGAFGSVTIVTESELAAEEDGRPDGVD